MDGDGEEGIKGRGIAQGLGDLLAHKVGKRDVSVEFEASYQDSSESLVLHGGAKPIQTVHPGAMGALSFLSHPAPGAHADGNFKEKSLASLAKVWSGPRIAHDTAFRIGNIQGEVKKANQKGLDF